MGRKRERENKPREKTDLTETISIGEYELEIILGCNLKNIKIFKLEKRTIALRYVVMHYRRSILNHTVMARNLCRKDRVTLRTSKKKTEAETNRDRH